MSFLNPKDVTQDTEGEEELDVKGLFQGCFQTLPCGSHLLSQLQKGLSCPRVLGPQASSYH